MTAGGTFAQIFSKPALNRKRMVFAFTVALLTDLIQLGLGPFGWVFADEGLDVVAMVLISAAIGFHTLLLPTFILELVPGPDMLPTWTGCTAAVIMLRKRARPSAPPTIEVASEVTPVHATEPGAAPPVQELSRPASSKT